MKKQNEFLKIGLTLGLLVSFGAHAEYDSGSYSDVDSGVDAVQSIKDKAASKTGSEDSGSAIEKLQDSVAQIGEARKRSDEEVKLREEVGALVKEKNKANKWILDAKARKSKDIEEKIAGIKDAEALAAQASKRQNNIDPSVFSAGDLPKACTNGVNLEQFRTSLETLGSRPASFFQTEFQSLIDSQVKDLSEKDKAAKQALLAEVAKNIDGLAELDGELKKEEKKSPYDQATLVKQLAILKKRKEEVKDEANDLRKSFAQIGMEELTNKFKPGGTEDKSKQQTQLATFFSDMVQDQTNLSINSGVDVAKNLKLNCDQEKQKVFSDIAQYRDALAASLQQKGDRPEVAQDKAMNDQNDGFMAHSQRATTLSCRNGEDGVLSAAMSAKSQIDTSLDAIRTEKNATRMVGKVMETMQAVGQLQATVGESLVDMKEDCKTVVQVRDVFKEKIAQVGGGQGAGGQVASSAGGNSGARSSSGKPVPQVGSSQNSSANHNSAVRR